MLDQRALRRFKPTLSTAALTLMLLPAIAHAQTGVSDDRLSLPEGPGSLEGVGENVDIDPNMGSMSYSVAINVPAGFPTVTPGLSLSYNSGSGGSEVGMGWSMPTQSIERMTYRGLPEYDTEDDFAADGGSQLVYLPGTSPRVYRARFEGGFMRYTWMASGDGDEGYWVCESPDGSVSHFGADAQGNLVPNARVSGDEGTFRYMLVEKTDVHGHRIRYDYIKDGHISLLGRISYVFKDGAPTYEVTFEFEERRDSTRTDYLSDAKAGFNELLTQRLRQINVLSRGIPIRRYQLSYEPYAAAGGFTRLVRVETIGARGDVYPIVFDFEYSQGLGQQRPRMTDMGSLGVNVTNGRATLIDITGDGLPDVLDTSDQGPHRFFINVPDANGGSAFDTAARPSAVGTGAAFRLEAAGVQTLDANGDGFTDLLNAATGQILLNRGNGDWEMNAPGNGTAELAEAFSADFDPEDGELQTLKFIDYDNDKRIDLMRSTPESTSVFRNMGAEGFVIDESVEAIGIGFAEDGAQLADINGDGLLDVVRVRPGSLLYKLNFGRGHWGPDVAIEGLPISEAQVEIAELEDINGDGLADLVVVAGDSITYALNTNTTAFADAIQIDSNDVEGDIPLRADGVAVLYADMNANGSSDVVWISLDGQVQTLDLFPVRPNLLTRITNAVGQVTDVIYSSSVVQLARDRDAGLPDWRYKLPFPMLVVDKIDRYDLLTDLHEEDIYSYHDGFYDGDEKQFRGYERVEMTGPGDDTQEDRFNEMRYEIGAENVYRKNLLVFQATSSDGRVLSEMINTYDDCPVAEIPEGTELPIRHTCNTGTRTTFKEGRDPAQWRTTESLSQYDGYGNVTRASDLGVIGTGEGGAGACGPCAQGRGPDDFGAPCGDQCLGDESFSLTSYIAPGPDTNDRWILSAAFRTRASGREGAALATEELTYYDGPDFVGLPLGQLDKALVTRTTVKKEVGADTVIETARNKHDAHGNVTETLDALGSPDGHTHHRRYAYDAENLRVTRAEVLLEDPDGQPYVLRREAAYEPLFDKASEMTSWLRVVDGQVVSNHRIWNMAYDQFGRETARFMPGNITTDPDMTYEYDLQSPASRIITRARSQSGGPLDEISIECFDGRGRPFQKRTSTGGDSFQVTGFTVHNLRSSAVRIYQPFTSTSAACDTSPPEGVAFTAFRYDATNRVAQTTLPDGALYGGQPTTTRFEYSPLVTTFFDAEDSDPSSPHKNTPTITAANGLGQTVAITRTLDNDGESATISMSYDGLGRLTQVVDPGGNAKAQFYDLLDRVTRVVDPNSAEEMTFEYDDASNVVRQTDDRGITTATEYDGMNRPVAVFDEADRGGTLIATTYDHDPDCPEALCDNGEGQAITVSYPWLGGERVVDHAGFDVRDRQVQFTRRIEGHDFTLRMAYDNRDRPIATTYPDGRTIEKTYDRASRLSAVPGIVARIGYDDRSILAEMDCADGSSTVMDHDDVMRPLQNLTTGAGGQTLQGWRFRRDRMNNILDLTDLTERAGAPAFEASFSYDAWYRVTSAHVGKGGADEETIDYSFDALDNITSVTSSLGADSASHVGDYSYDSFAPNAVTEAGGAIIDYDAAGNVVERGDLGFVWDFKNRMTAVTRGGQPLQTNVYGADQSRIARIDDTAHALYPADDFQVLDGISTIYVKVGHNRVARIESDALATALLGDPVADGQLNAADALIAPEADGDRILRASARRLLIETGPDDGTTFLHRDHIGSLTLATGLVDGQQRVLGQRSFDPLGNERPDSSGYVDEYGFTGQQIDRATGLVHFDWRYYDPRIGRWLSIDPAFATSGADNITQLGESTTAYNYVAGNFINAFDPTGLDGKTSEALERTAGDGKIKATGTRKDKLFTVKEVKKKKRPWSKVETLEGVKTTSKVKVKTFEVGSEGLEVYHATSSAGYKVIKTAGLDPHFGDDTRSMDSTRLNSNGYNYFSIGDQTAKDYGGKARDTKRAPYVLLKVTLPPGTIITVDPEISSPGSMAIRTTSFIRPESIERVPTD